MVSMNTLQAGLSNVIFGPSISHIPWLASGVIFFIGNAMSIMALASRKLRGRPIIPRLSTFKPGLGASGKRSP